MKELWVQSKRDTTLAFRKHHHAAKEDLSLLSIHLERYNKHRRGKRNAAYSLFCIGGALIYSDHSFLDVLTRIIVLNHSTLLCHSKATTRRNDEHSRERENSL
jgi:hypothetical protein